MTKAEPKLEAVEQPQPRVVLDIEEHPLVIALRAEIAAMYGRQAEEVRAIHEQNAAEMRKRSLEFTTERLELQDRVIDLQTRILKLQQSKLFP